MASIELPFHAPVVPSIELPHFSHSYMAAVSTKLASHSPPGMATSAADCAAAVTPPHSTPTPSFASTSPVANETTSPAHLVSGAVAPVGSLPAEPGPIAATASPFLTAIMATAPKGDANPL